MKTIAHTFVKYFLLLTIYILNATAVFSQTQGGTWTWMSGDAGAGVPVYGTQGVPSTSNKPPGLANAACWTDLTGKFWLYGGFEVSPIYQVQADLWMFDPSTQMWTWVKGPGNSPSPLEPVYGTQGVSSPTNTPGSRRYAYSWTDNSGNLWLYGGVRYNSPYSYSDLWKYNITTNEWTWMKGSNSLLDPGTYGTMGVSDAANNPSARAHGNATWTDNSGNLWLFGGAANTNSGSGNILNDLWKYDVSTNNWTWMKGSNTPGDYWPWVTMGVPDANNRPSSRSTSFRWKDNAGNLWLYGGLGISGVGQYTYLNDLWKYDISTNMWTWVNGPLPGNMAGSMATSCSENNTNRPSARYDHSGGACMVDKCGNFWLYGGEVGAGFSDDKAIWRYNPSTNEWAWVGNLSDTPNYGTLGVSNTSNNPPAPRQNSNGWFDLNGNLWTGFGWDVIDYNVRNDLWKFTPDYCSCLSCTLSCSAIALPIELLYFKAECVGNKVNLLWSTASESNNSYFTIERTEDGIIYTPVKTVAGAGNSTTKLDYYSSDFEIEVGKIYYYRLKQTDFNGAYRYYSDIEAVNCTPEDIYFSNPSNGYVYIHFPNSDTQVTYTIIDNLGKVVTNGELSTEKNIINLSHCSNGLYYIRFKTSVKEISKKLIINH